MPSWIRPLASFLCGLVVVGCFSDVNTGSGGDSATASGSSTTNGGGSTNDGTSSTQAGTTQTSFDGSSTFGTSGTSRTAGSTEVGPEMCGPTEECFPQGDLPGGWTGPFLVHSYPLGQEGPACPAQWSEVVGAPTFADPLSEPLTCACTCGADVQYTCEFVLTAYTEAGCGGIQTAVTVTPGCTELPAATMAAAATATPVVAVACGPGTATAVVMPPPFSSRIRVCEPERSANTCEGGDCLAVPAVPPPATQLCVAEGGQQSCDNLQPFTERHFAFAAFTDTRECDSGCSCNAAPVCTAELTVTPGDACMGLGEPASLGQCVNNPGGSAAFTGGAGTTACEGPSGEYESTGASIPNGTAATYCCIPAS